MRRASKSKTKPKLKLTPPHKKDLKDHDKIDAPPAKKRRVSTEEKLVLDANPKDLKEGRVTRSTRRVLQPTFGYHDTTNLLVL